VFVYDLLKVGGVYPYKYLNGVAVTHLRAKARYRVLVVRFTDDGCDIDLDFFGLYSLDKEPLLR